MNHQSHKDQALPPRKRLRPGPRSCAECRRRRVRCVFPESGQPCEACSIHNVRCRPQRQSDDQTSGIIPFQSIGTSSIENNDLGQTLAQLSAQVQNLHEALLTKREASLNIFREPPRSQEYLRQQEDTSSRSFPKDDDNIQDSTAKAPLMNSFGNAIKVDLKVALSSRSTSSNSTSLAQNLLNELRQILPDRLSLYQILTETEPYWGVWPTFFYGPSRLDCIRIGHRDAAMVHLSSALSSNDPLYVTKAIIWLALCIQQMSQKWINDEKAAVPAKELVKSYTETATMLLSINTAQGVGSSIMEVECSLLLHRACINQGKARAAWSTIKNGIASACLQGLHCLDSSKSLHSSDIDLERRIDLWRQLCQADILLSLFLGFPLSVSASNLPKPDINDKRAVMMTEMLRIAISVTQRNQGKDFEDYSTTAQLDQDWNHCIAMFPPEWWHTSPDPNLGVQACYRAQAAKILVSLVGKFIHLPFLMKARSDARYTQSRLTVIKTSLQIMEAYNLLRNNSSTQFILCDLMDFQAFGAAFSIALELSSAPFGFTANEDPEMQVGSLWDKVASLASTLRQTSLDLDCKVAAQSAEVLDTLHTAHHEPSSEMDQFEAEIPYFGKVRITGLNQSSSNSITSTIVMPPSSLDFTSSSTFDASIEYFNYLFPNGFQDAVELGVDWAEQL